MGVKNNMAKKSRTNMEEAFRKAQKEKQKRAEKVKADKVRKDGAGVRKQVANAKKKKGK